MTNVIWSKQVGSFTLQELDIKRCPCKVIPREKAYQYSSWDQGDKTYHFGAWGVDTESITEEDLSELCLGLKKIGGNISNFSLLDNLNYVRTEDGD